MKRMLWMIGALLTLTAGIATAAGGGINLGWDDCGGLPATENRTFACDTNLGINTVVGSFVAPCCLTRLAANEVVMDLRSMSVTLPSWWQFKSGQCRPVSLNFSLDFTGGPFTCVDYWQGGAVGGITEDPFVGNRARIKMVFALHPDDPRLGPVPEGQEIYSYKCNISNRSTTGLGSCAGCDVGVCIVLNSIRLIQPSGTPGGSQLVSAPASRNWVIWQGGIGTDCYAATPTRDATWGSIKALYR